AAHGLRRRLLADRPRLSRRPSLDSAHAPRADRAERARARESRPGGAAPGGGGLRGGSLAARSTHRWARGEALTKFFGQRRSDLLQDGECGSALGAGLAPAAERVQSLGERERDAPPYRLRANRPRLR